MFRNVVYDSFGRAYLALRPASIAEAFWRGSMFLWGVSVGIGGTAFLFMIFLIGIGA